MPLVSSPLSLFYPVRLPAKRVAATLGGCIYPRRAEYHCLDCFNRSLMPDLPSPSRRARPALEQSIEARNPQSIGPIIAELAAALRALGRLAHELGDFPDAQSLRHRGAGRHTESLVGEHRKLQPATTTLACVAHRAIFAASHLSNDRCSDEQAFRFAGPTSTLHRLHTLDACRYMGDLFRRERGSAMVLSSTWRHCDLGSPRHESLTLNRSLLG